MHAPRGPFWPHRLLLLLTSLVLGLDLNRGFPRGVLTALQVKSSLMLLYSFQGYTHNEEHSQMELVNEVPVQSDVSEILSFQAYAEEQEVQNIHPISHININLLVWVLSTYLTT